ncbi:MAG: flagellar filament capping protein FliD [Gammaproteobacteria bacterium]|nr:flagellar filament capping protein FliD [Gammaproteobacteria bacterium]
MAITAAGVGSGIDIETIVSQLMTLERQPLTALERRESDTRAQISAYGSLRSAVSTFQTAMRDLSTLDAFRVFLSESSDEDVMTASADSDAAAGIYNLNVTRLAQNHKMGSGQFAATDTFGGGAGDALTLTVGTDSATIDLSTASTLEQVRDAINSATDNPGVTATILNVSATDQRLILTADESGYEDRVQLSYGGAINATTFNFATTNQDNLGATLVDLTELDASYSIDGFALTAASNSISTVIDGLSIDLKGVGSATLNVTRDNASIEESAKAFVDAYNGVLSTIDSLRADDLSGDSTLRSIVSGMRNTINTLPTGLTGSYNALSQLGIKTDRDTGQLTFDSGEFNSALDTDFASVAQVFANDDQGFAFRFAALADSFLDEDGLIDSRVDGLNTRVRRLDDEQADLERRLDLREIALRREFAALDQLVGSLQSTSNFLFQNFTF